MANFYGQYVGFGAGGAAAPFVFGGTNYGYASGSFAPPAPYSRDWIQKFSFSSDDNATDSGNLTVAVWGGAGIGNNVYGYCCGGYLHPAGPQNEINRFLFASGGDAVEVGDLSQARSYPHATSDKSTYAYIHGGEAPSKSDVIDRFSFASGTENAGDVGDLSVAASWCAGASTATHGYLAQGWTGSSSTVIERYAFAETSDSAGIGDLELGSGHGAAGVTSTTHGYYIRVATANPAGQDIQKYAFAASSDGAAIGDSPVANARYKSGTSSTTHGYLAGGHLTATTDGIEKFSLTSDEDSAAIADLYFGADEGQAGTEY